MRHTLTAILFLAATPAVAQCPPYCGPGVIMPVPDPNWPPPPYVPPPSGYIMPVIPPQEDPAIRYERDRYMWREFYRYRFCDPRVSYC